MKNIYFFLVALMVTTLSFGQEILLNGDMELWDNPTSPTSWTKAEALNQETADVHGGANAAKRNAGSGTKDLSQTVTVVGGDSYTISFWYKVVSGDGTDARIWSNWKSGATNLTDNAADLKGPNNAYLPDTAGAWSQYSVTLSAPVSADALYFEVRSYSGSVVIWDDLSVMHNAVAPPTISVTAPLNGATLLSGDVTISVGVANFVVGNPGPGVDGHISWTLDSGSGPVAQPMKYDTNDETLTGLADGTYTVEMTLVDDSDTPIAPPTSSSVTFDVVTPASVGDIATLRAGTIGNYYQLTGQALLTYQQSHRNQKFIEDATAGILIDDSAGNITTTYAIGDGITGIKGKLTAYQGMMQFQPTEDAGAPSSTGNTLTPQTVTLADLTANPENYESELVKVVGVTMDNTTPNFANNSVHTLTQGADTFDFKSRFFSADYVTASMAVPTASTDITGIVTERPTGSYWLTARDANDISQLLSVADNTIEGFNIYPNPARNVITIVTKLNQPKKVEIFNILGKQVLNATVENTLNVNNLQAGVYIVKVTENNVSATRKLIIK